MSNIDYQNLEEKLNYKFRDINLLFEALSHPSINHKIKKTLKKNYQRLELLGDAVLYLVVTEMLLLHFPNVAEGVLAKKRAHLISTEIINNVALEISLPDYIIMSDGEENSGGRENKNNIEDAMEALLAAIYVDSDIKQVSKIIQRLWLKFLDVSNFSELDPKTYVQEILQKNKFPVPMYKIINQSGPAHNPFFEVQLLSGKYSSIGDGQSVKEAQKNAAKALIKILIK